ncbi:malonate--CoA ligase [Caulobacter mirabilis]|uniref:Malonyl-CoA synthase n=1 Tax=Caulobacter mirabilis TaxID=69666 RepID=A0A2D2AYL0_9CAUL|nr:malonyl-CoA synthase [Caulobacter mirabilis]ATQ43098.1 malonyl-CoA synthase [Caulobacter mirabilis]
MNLFDVLTANADPAAPFLERPDGRIDSYADLQVHTARLANSLTALGVKPGDRVAVQVEKTPENLYLYLATIRAGAVFLPLNTAYTIRELDYFIGDAGPRLIVCDPAVQEDVEDLVDPMDAKVVTLDGLGQGSLSDIADSRSTSFATVVREASDLAAICYTSGTTGRSKGAMLTHGNLASNAATLVELWRFTPKDVLIHALPIYHVHGLFVATNVLLMAGGSMIFRPKFDAAEALSLFPRATALMGVPTFYTRLLAQPGLDAEAARGMRLFVSGSAPLLAEVHDQWRARTGTAILERYGMTETGMNTSNPYDGDRVAGTVGFPLPDVSLRIADPETGAAVPQGEIGMIEVKGPNVFAGYWNMPEKTAAEFRPDGYFITGDLGRVDDRGYVHIVGRGKDLIISGGFNVYPKEVEEEIDALPGVVESAVIGLPHPDLGEGVTAVVATGGKGAMNEEAVIAALKDRLARFKQPKRVLFVDDLPRNAMGKVQKALLREQHAGLYSGGS